ncbi:MAG: hypothetical protein IKQ60_06760 [Candidatus Methanomethylophilaceae archaeon]|nr:hypothetical protein [Candidatus Methanomethylophilaceae archaeon]
MTEAKWVCLDFSLGRSEYNRRFKGSVPGRPPAIGSEAYRTSFSVSLTMACMYRNIKRNITPEDIEGFEKRARAVRGWTVYAVRKHHKIASGSAQDVKNEVVAAIIANSLVTFFEKGRFKEYEDTVDIDELGKMLKNPSDRSRSDLAGHMMGFPKLFSIICSNETGDDACGEGAFLPVEICNTKQCGFVKFCILHPYVMTDIVRSDAPVLPDCEVEDIKLEDATLSLVGMCKTIDHEAGVSRLNSPGTSMPYPDLPFRNVIAFGHYQSISEEGMQGSNPVRFYRIYDDERPYIMDLRHYPRTLENSIYDNNKVRSPLKSVKDPFVIMGALNPFAKKWVKHILKDCKVKTCKIEEKMLEANPNMDPPDFNTLVKFIDKMLQDEHEENNRYKGFMLLEQDAEKTTSCGTLASHLEFD